MVLAPLAVPQGDVVGGLEGLGFCFQQLKESVLLLLSAFLDWFGFASHFSFGLKKNNKQTRQTM